MEPSNSFDRLSEFGPFTEFLSNERFRPAPYHQLRGLGGPNIQDIFSRIERILTECDPRPWIDAIFRQANWRPHLIGALAVILDDGKSLSPEPLWRQIERHSWVSPQLVFAVWIVDPEFCDRLCQHLNQEILLVGRDSKALASLIAVGRQHPLISNWVDEFAHRPEIESRLATERYQADGFAEAWLDRLRTHLGQRGRTWHPRSLEAGSST